MQRLARLVGAEQDEMKLHVGGRQFRAGLGKDPPLACSDGERPGPLDEPLHPHQYLLPGALHPVVQGDRLGAAIDRACLKVILQIGADAALLPFALLIRLLIALDPPTIEF